MLQLVPFQVVERRDSDGTPCVALIGELDLAVANQVAARLEKLCGDNGCVRLDLSRLEFIDSTGMRTLVRAAQHRSANGNILLEIGHDIPRSVEMVIDLLDVAHILWPTGRSLN